MPTKLPSADEQRERQLAYNAVLRLAQQPGPGRVGYGSKPASLPEISRAPKRSPKQGALASKRAVRLASR